jgi:hypothetical protein
MTVDRAGRVTSEPSVLTADDASLIERNLSLSYTERLDQLVRIVAFIRAGQAALTRVRG